MKCASWALDHNVGVVISNGQMDKGILNIIDGKKIGTFFTNVPNQSLPVDVQAVKGNRKIGDENLYCCLEWFSS